MNWDAIGAAGDLIGGIGVVVSLIYLAVQVRQANKQVEFNTKAVQASSYQSALSLSGEMNTVFVKDRDFAEFVFFTDPEDLDPIDQVRWQVWHVMSFRQQQHFHAQFKNGLLPEDSWASHEVGLRRTLALPAVQRLWERRRGEFSGEFGDCVEALLAEIGGRHAV